MKNLTGKKFEAIRPEGVVDFYVGSWHKIKLGEKVKVGKKDVGYKVSFIVPWAHKDISGYYGKNLWCINEQDLSKYFVEIK